MEWKINKSRLDMDHQEDKHVQGMRTTLYLIKFVHVIILFNVMYRGK